MELRDSGFCLLGSFTEDVNGTAKQLLLPIGDLIGMHIILLDQLRHGEIPLAGSQCYFGFEIG